MAIEDLKITLSVTVPQKLAKDIEDLRGTTPRSEYLRVIITEFVKKQKATPTSSGLKTSTSEDNSRGR